MSHTSGTGYITGGLRETPLALMLISLNFSHENAHFMNGN
jgi:hypothetical protein